MESHLHSIYNNMVLRIYNKLMYSQFRFFIELTDQEYLNYYAGDATSVQVRTEDGLRIQFPASALKPWITHNGIHGYFMIKFDKNYKLIELTKLK